SIPLFFVVVKTNVDYQVVGSFAIQEETKISIQEALGIVKGWNEAWKPKLFMTDNCEEEIRAVESNFPDENCQH
uniref:transposase n=1 Tax=Acinetobacter baumannii TaxID=470 RepID=UPI001C07D823